jgi:exopolysaccharide biosynthesis protein
LLGACQGTVEDEVSYLGLDWKSDQLREGVNYHSVVDQDSPKGKQTIHIVEIDSSLPDLKVSFAHSDGQLKPTSFWADATRASIAINASFFDPDNGGAVTYFKDEGTLINPTITDPDELLFLSMLDEGAIVLDEFDAKLIEKPEDGWDSVSAYNSILSSGPLLMMDGVVLEQEDIPFMTDQHARTAFGIGEDRYFLVIVDGYSDQASGISMPDLGGLMKEIGSVSAINLDGGGSSTLWARTRNGPGVLNYPTDNDVFDHEGERAVANSVLIHLDRQPLEHR